jgi:putative integral membrane protein (TIGR02587 family)
MSRKNGKRTITRSLQEYLRGIAGGLLFSLPLLYTMEVWWAGFITHPLRLLIYILATFTLLLGYNRYCGLRCDASPTDVAIDSIEEMGLGLVIAAFVLWLLGQITSDMAISEIVGKIIIEAMTVAIGVSIGTAQLGGEDNQEDDTGMKQDTLPLPFIIEDDNGDFGGQLTIALCGAVLFAANVAPTEEVIMIATETTSSKLLVMALLSLLIGGLILFYIDFNGSQRFSKTRSIKTVLFGATVTYAIALFASTAILWFFGRFDGIAPIICLSEIIVLGLAATLGASAGRLLLQ